MIVTKRQRENESTCKTALKCHKLELSIMSSYRDMSDKTFPLAWKFIAPRVPELKASGKCSIPFGDLEIVWI